jgi:hypothetical protein
MLNPLVHHKPVSMGSQWAIYVATHADMQDSIGLMIDKKVASKRIS